jgi:hypothetical protein
MKKHPQLKHIKHGDIVIAVGSASPVLFTAVCKINHKRGLVTLNNGRVVSGHELCTPSYLVCPVSDIPAALLEVLGKLVSTSHIVVVRVLTGTAAHPVFTLADAKTGERLRSVVHSKESADVDFENGEGYEHKLTLETSSTEYYVGDTEIVFDDDFEINRCN